MEHIARKKPRKKHGVGTARHIPPVASPFVMRVNILLTEVQHATLQDWARDEGRPMPNLIRRLIDQSIASRPK
jgi:hypothetical protein